MLLLWKHEKGPVCLDYHGGLAQFSFPEHQHQGAWELVVVLSGTLFHTVNGIRLEQPPGTATLIRECDRHALEGTHLEFANLSFHVGFIEALARIPRAADDAIGGALDAPGPLWCRIPAVERDRLKADLDGLDVHLGSAEEGVRLLSILTRVLLGCRENAHRPLLTAEPEWLAPVRALITDLGQPVPDLDGLRRLAGVSPEHLARTCRRHLRMSPSEFLNHCRVQRAASTLKAQPELAISTIAGDCGFASLGYFTRCFRKAFGISPQVWRKRQALADVREVVPWAVRAAEDTINAGQPRGAASPPRR